MSNPFYQGWLDSLCGIYSIVNAHRLVTNATEQDSQRVFNEIITHLSKKKKLKEVMLGGITHKIMQDIMFSVMVDRFSKIETNKKQFYSLNAWWKYSREFMQENEHSSIILSLGGQDNHLTTIKSMTSKSLLLFDSNVGAVRMLKSQCSIVGYSKDDRYVIYPTQCFYLN